MHGARSIPERFGVTTSDSSGPCRTLDNGFGGWHIADTGALFFLYIMASAGHVEIKGKAYPRMQILSVEEILEGKGFDTPTKLGRHLDFQIRMDFE